MISYSAVNDRNDNTVYRNRNKRSDEIKEKKTNDRNPRNYADNFLNILYGYVDALKWERGTTRLTGPN